MRIEPSVAVLVASGYSEIASAVGEQVAGATGFIRKRYEARDAFPKFFKGVGPESCC